MNVIQISGAESVVMEALWRRSPLAAEDVIGEVAEPNGWTEATVKTLINRLLKKKAIDADRDGRRYLYRPLVARADYVASESQGLLDRLFDGRLAPLVSHFFQTRKLSEQDIAELKALIKDAEQETMIKTINGVAQYLDGYQGAPTRAPDEDPFISPSNAALVLIDYQPHIMMGVRNIDHEVFVSNTTGLVKSAVHFGLPIIFSHVGVGLSGAQPFLTELVKLAPDAVIIDRTNVNAWEEPEFVAAVEAIGRKKLIMGGLWTDVCLAYPAIEAANAGYEVLVPEDTIGSITQLSHDNGMKRMEAAGVKPITWNVVLAELQRDHARKDTEKETSRIFMEYLFKMDPDKGWEQ